MLKAASVSTGSADFRSLPVMNDTATAMSNEKFIAEFLDWRLQWKNADQDEVPIFPNSRRLPPRILCAE